MRLKMLAPIAAILLATLLFQCSIVPADSTEESIHRADSAQAAGNSDYAVNLGRAAIADLIQNAGAGDRSAAYSYARFWKELEAKIDSASGANALDSVVSCHLVSILQTTQETRRDDSLVAGLLDHLGSYYRSGGSYSKAKLLLWTALRLRQRLFRSVHPEIARNLNSLAAVLSELREYDGACGLYYEAWLTIKACLKNGEDSPDKLFDLYRQYVDLRDNFGALFTANKIVLVEERLFDDPNPFIWSDLSNLAGDFELAGKHDVAQKLLWKAYRICGKCLGPKHTQTAHSLLALAYHYDACHAVDLADSLFRESLQTLVLSGHSSVTIASIYSRLGSIAQSKGSDCGAESLFVRAIQLGEEYAPGDWRATKLVSDLVSFYRSHSKVDSALALSERVLNRCLITTKDAVAYLPENEVLALSAQINYILGGYLTCWLDLEPGSIRRDSTVIDAVLRLKGWVLELMIGRYTLASSSTDANSSRLIDSLNTIKNQKAKFFVDGRSTIRPTYFERDLLLDSLGSITRRIETEIAARSADLIRQNNYWRASVSCYDSLLPLNSALVEYLKWDYLQVKPGSSMSRYLAVVLNRDSKPVIVDLGDASVIDQLVESYRQHMRRVSIQKHMPLKKDQQDYAQIGHALHAKIWEPLEDEVTGKELVFVSPDGGLNLVSFAGLLSADGKFLAEKFALQYLSTGRDLNSLKNQPIPASGLFALADPDYDASPSARKTGMVGSEPAALPSADHYAARNVRSGCSNLSEMRVSALPGTREEVSEIVMNWRSSSQQQALAYFGSNASEDNFKRNAPGKRVIHLATHGYYLERKCEGTLLSEETPPERVFLKENPLLLSGLLLAGANLHGVGSDSANIEDGILTAEEVSALNLQGAKLVVLSACESGLGEVEDGDGVYGLRRAFQMAGARTVVSALWNVYDQTTAEMMKELYRSSDEPIPVRMRNMQLAQIKKLRAEGLPDHPFSWGAFVATGDWR